MRGYPLPFLRFGVFQHVSESVCARRTAASAAANAAFATVPAPNLAMGTLTTEYRLKPPKVGEGWGSDAIPFCYRVEEKHTKPLLHFFSRSTSARSGEATVGASVSPASSAIFEATVRRSVWRGSRPIGRKSVPHRRFHDTLCSCCVHPTHRHTHTPKNKATTTPNTDI